MTYPKLILSHCGPDIRYRVVLKEKDEIAIEYSEDLDAMGEFRWSEIHDAESYIFQDCIRALAAAIVSDRTRP